MSDSESLILQHAVVSKLSRDWADYALQSVTHGPHEPRFFEGLFHQYADAAPQNEGNGSSGVAVVSFVPERNTSPETLTVIYRHETKLRDAGGRPIDRADFLVFDRESITRQHSRFADLLRLTREYLTERGAALELVGEPQAQEAYRVSFATCAQLAAIVLERPTLLALEPQSGMPTPAESVIVLDCLFDVLPAGLRFAEPVATFLSGAGAPVRTALVPTSALVSHEAVGVVSLRGERRVNLSPLASDYLDSIRLLHELNSSDLSRVLAEEANAHSFSQAENAAQRLSELSMPLRLIREFLSRGSAGAALEVDSPSAMQSPDSTDQNRSMQISVCRILILLGWTTVKIPVQLVLEFAGSVEVEELAKAAVQLDQFADLLPGVRSLARTAEYVRLCVASADLSGADLDTMLQVAAGEVGNGTYDVASFLGLGNTSSRMALLMLERAPRIAARYVDFWPSTHSDDHPLYGFWIATRPDGALPLEVASVDCLAGLVPSAPYLLMVVAAHHGTLDRVAGAVFAWCVKRKEVWVSRNTPEHHNGRRLRSVVVGSAPRPEVCALVDLFLAADPGGDCAFLGRATLVKDQHWRLQYTNAMFRALEDIGDANCAAFIRRLEAQFARTFDAGWLVLVAELYRAFRSKDAFPDAGEAIRVLSINLLSGSPTAAVSLAEAWLGVLCSEAVAGSVERRNVIDLIMCSAAEALSREDDGLGGLARLIADALRTHETWSPSRCVEQFAATRSGLQPSDLWTLWLCIEQRLMEAQPTGAASATPIRAEARVQLGLTALPSCPELARAYASLVLSNMIERVEAYAGLVADAGAPTPRFSSAALGEFVSASDTLARNARALSVLVN